MTRRLTALALPFAALGLLAGCGSTDGLPEPMPTATVTATVTATPPPRSADDALTALDAWTACSGAVRATYVLENPETEVFPYSADSVVVQPDGSYEVTVAVGNPASTVDDPIYGVQATCLVAGTVSEPEIVSFGFIGLG
jgi:ABC-type transport system substrate-binding protein